MDKKISRRQILGIGAATLAGGVALLGKEGEAHTHGGGSSSYQPAPGQTKPVNRPYWEKSYSGGLVDVKPLPAVLPGKGYRPVVVPNGAEAVRGAALVVNATPIGLDGHAQPIDVRFLASDAAVLDLVFSPSETPFVHAARARGLRASDGLQMLLAQGALAFERWFGIAPDRDAMRAAVAR